MKKLTVCLFVLIATFTVFADDFGSDFESWDDFGSETESSDSKGVQIGGCVSTDFRYYFSSSKNPVKILPDAEISLSHEGDKAGFSTTLKVNENLVTDYPLDIIDELSIRGYFGNLFLEAGKLRVVWGKGDKFHIIDNFNSDDYTNFIIPDYIDRRISIPMIRGKYSFEGDSNVAIEAVFTPFIAKDRYNTSGMFVPGSVTSLKSTLTAAGVSTVSTLFNGTSSNPQMVVAYNAALLRANSIEDNIYPNLYTMKYFQAGARLTGTFKSFDWGASFYAGRYKKPSMDLTKFNGWMTQYLLGQDPDLFLEYDKKYTIGFEGATTLWHFNLRNELAYNFTKDMDCTDMAVHNPSLQWLVGFDIDLPLWNMNLNIQETGTAVMGSDKVKNGDVDYNKHGLVNNRFIANVSASFINDTLKPEISMVWCIESKDFALMPKLTYSITPELSANLVGLYVYSKDSDSQFYGFDNGDCAQFGVSYKF